MFEFEDFVSSAVDRYEAVIVCHQCHIGVKQKSHDLDSASKGAVILWVRRIINASGNTSEL